MLVKDLRCGHSFMRCFRQGESPAGYLGGPALGVGLQVLSQADEGDEQGRGFEEAHVVDIDALLMQRAAVHC